MIDTLELYGTVNDSIVDGPGLRYVVFVQGCPHHCKGCHNPESHERGRGTVTPIAHIIADIQANPLIRDITISGGEPFDQAEACAQLAQQLKQNGYGVWVYTGYTYENLLKRSDPATELLLNNTDVLVDGPYIEAQHSYDLDWRGSKNQRIIDLGKTRESGRITPFKSEPIAFERPENW